MDRSRPLSDTVLDVSLVALSFLFVYLYICVSGMCVCAYVCVNVSIMKAYGGHKSVFEWLPQSLSTLCFETGALTASGAHWLARMTGKPF